MARLLEPWRRSWRDHRGAWLALALAGLAMIAWLGLGPKPWISGVAPHEAAGEKLRPEHHAVTGLWWAAWINLAIVIGLMALAPLLLRRLPADMPRTAKLGLDSRGRWMLFGVLALAAAVSGLLQAPRLSFSLWGDEEYTAKRFVAGYYRRADDGSMEHKRPSWVGTAWDFRSGANNHQLFSLLSRVSHSLHEPSADPQEVYFSEELIRLPSFLASLGTVMAVGWLVALLGAPRGAVVAAFFLALHPWFLRYGPEARGYALLMLLSTLTLIALLKASSSGKWRYWLAFGLLEFLTFFSYLGSVHFILMLNLSALLLVLKGQRSPGARHPQFGRFVVANAMAASLVAIAVAPIISPLRAWYRDKVQAGAWGEPPNLAWMLDEAAYLATGIPWQSWDPSNPFSLHLASQSPVLAVAALAVVALLGILGVVALLGHGRCARLLLAPLALPGPLMLIVALVKENFLFPWYLLVSLPMIALFVGLGAEWLGRRVSTPVRQNIVVVAAAFACFALMLAVAHERIHLLRTQSVERLYESVALTRKIINPAHPEIDRDVITVGFAMWTEGYDPAARFVHNAEELRAVLDEARASGRELYVNFGQFLLAREAVPDLMAMIEDESLFEPVAVLHGLWQPCTRWVYRAVPDGASAAATTAPGVPADGAQAPPPSAPSR